MKNDLLKSFDCAEERVAQIVSNALQGADDGELFVEYSQVESLMFDDGRLKSGNFSCDQGFGLRSVAAEAVGYAHSGDLSEAALLRASDTAMRTRLVRPVLPRRCNCCSGSIRICGKRIRKSGRFLQRLPPDGRW